MILTSVYALIRTIHKHVRINTDFQFVNFVFSQIKHLNLCFEVPIAKFIW